MYLNTLKPAPGSKSSAKRVGRGIGSTLGKTCGTGHKGQKSRSGGFHKTGFEGGQMPVQRRLPKFGFSSRRKVLNAQVTLKELSSLAAANPIDLSVLKSYGIVPKSTLKAKIILSGEISVAVVTKGLMCTKSAKDAILSAGGTVED